MNRRRYPKSIWSHNPLPTGTGLYLPLWNNGLHGTTFKSIDPFGHTCIRTGGVMGGQGFTADGNDYISIGDPAVLDFTGKFTIAIWTFTTNTSGARVFSKQKVDTLPVWEILTLSNEAHFRVLSSAPSTYATSGALACPINEWHLIIGTYDQVNLVVDVDLTTLTGGAYSAALIAGDDAEIGRRKKSDNTFDSFYIGTVGEAWIWPDVALTAGERNHLFYNSLQRFQ